MADGSGDERRRERLAAALRANLKRRKAPAGRATPATLSGAMDEAGAPDEDPRQLPDPSDRDGDPGPGDTP